MNSPNPSYLRTLLDAARQACFLVAPDGTVLEFNEKARALIQALKGKELARGINIIPLGFPEEQAQFRSELEAVLRGESIEKVTETTLTNGQVQWLELGMYPARDEGGKVFAIVLNALDITEAKMAEAALLESEREASRLALIASKTDNSIIITDADMRIQWVNNGFFRNTGYTLDEVRGKIPGHVLQGPKTDPETVAFMRESLEKGQNFQVQVLNYTKSGQEIWIDLEVQPLYNDSGELVQYFGIQSDITQRKRYEEELQQAKESAETADKAKSEFLSNMSHEIRTPLNAVIALTDLMLNQSLDHHVAENLKAIRFSSRNLLVVINDILDFSKIEAGKLAIDKVKFDLRQMIDEAVRSLEPKARERGLTLETHIDQEIPHFLTGDPVRLNQIILNLLGNAIKFTEKGHVRVQADLQGMVGKELTIRFAISDTGIGIAQDKVDFIFESFTQSDSDLRRKHGGTGLGLAITKKLVKMMGGTIEVSSEVNVGSTFSFELPFERVGQAQARNAYQQVPKT